MRWRETIPAPVDVVRVVADRVAAQRARTGGFANGRRSSRASRVNASDGPSEFGLRDGRAALAGQGSALLVQCRNTDESSFDHEARDDLCGAGLARTCIPLAHR